MNLEEFIDLSRILLTGMRLQDLTAASMKMTAFWDTVHVVSSNQTDVSDTFTASIIRDINTPRVKNCVDIPEPSPPDPSLLP
jgi:hypothetical protein